MTTTDTATRRHEEDKEIAAIIARNPLARSRFFFEMRTFDGPNSQPVLWSRRCGHTVPVQDEPLRVDDCPKCDWRTRPNLAWDLHVAKGGD